MHHVTERGYAHYSVAQPQRNDSVGAQSAVLASEILQLPNLQGFLKFSSTPAWARVALKP
jgi:hypothetical protein